MLQTLVRRSATTAPRFPFNIHTNPYRCKRSWPPDFSQLSEKHQFRLERRYRRRAKLKWARPRWTKGVKLAQWGSILFVLTYGIFFMDTGDHGSPFDGIRRWYTDATNSMWTSRNGEVVQDAGPTASQKT